MAEREADRANPERLRQQAIVALVSDAQREISPEFRQRLREHDAAPRLADSSGGDVVIKREAQLIDPDRYPDRYAMAEQNIRQLLRRHKSEWDGFMSSYPSVGGFAR